MEYENTLLIVESPEIARRIDRLNIPYLTTFSTDGFLWWPKLTSNGEGLTLKARTEQNGVEKRRELKKNSSYATKVICATDRDPAGEFIAWSVERYLKRSCLHQTLTDLSKSGILRLIQQNEEAASQPEPSVLHGLMLLQEIDYNSPQKLLFTLFDDILQFKNAYLSPVDSSDFIIFARQYLRDKSVTLPKLLAEIHDRTGLTFKEIYEETWNIFLIPESLITYPRSVHRGFYDETWKRLSTHSPVSNSALCLSAIQPIVSPVSAHESIRATDVQIIPEETKKWLSKTQRIIYRYLWEQTNSIYFPDYEELETVWKSKKKSNPHIYSGNISLSAIYEMAARYGLIRNSNIYKTLSYLYPDKLSSNSHINTDQEPLQKHFNELYEWLKQPMNHPKKRKELRKISVEILRLKMR